MTIDITNKRSAIIGIGTLLSFIAVLFFPHYVSAAGVWSKYLNGNNISDIAVSDGVVWSVTDGGLVRWNIADKTPVLYTRDDGLMSNQLSMVEADGLGIPWFTYENSPYKESISRFTGDTITTYNAENSGLPEARIRSAFFDNRGDWWVGAVWGGVSHFDGEIWETFVPENVFDSAARNIVEDSNGVVWIATNNGVWTLNDGEWNNYTVEDGLAGNSVNDIAIDDRNVIWIATSNGASAFDGEEWVTYGKSDGLINNNINTMIIDRNGVKWFGTDYGVTRFDGVTWETFTDQIDLIDNQVTDIAEDSFGNLWFSHRDAGGGVTVYNGRDWIWYTIWTPFADLPSNNVYTVAADDNGYVWLATGKGIVKYDGSTWTTFDGDGQLKSYEAHKIIVDDDGSLWLAYGRFNDLGTVRFDGSSWASLDENDGLGSNGVLSIYRGSDGTLYFGTNIGLAVYDGENWQRYPENNRLISPNIYDIGQNIDGSMWFATSKGLSRYDGSLWNTYYTGDPFIDDMIYIESGSDGTMWGLSSFGNLMSITDGEFTQHSIVHEDIGDGDSEKIASFTIDDDGVIWAMTTDLPLFDEMTDMWMSYLWSYNGDSWRRYTLASEQFFSEVRKMDSGEDGGIWLATETGLLRFFSGTLDAYLFDGPVSNYIRDITVNGDNLLTITTDSGISFSDGSKWANIHGSSRRDIAYDGDNVLWLTDVEGVLRYDGGEWTLLNADNGDVFYQTVTYEYDEKRDVMWIGTVFGLWKYDGVNWEYFSEDKGGFLDGIKDIEIDHNGVVWMTVGINSGVWSYDGSTFRQYTSGDGLVFDRTNQIAVDGNNTKWIGTVKGLSAFNDTTWTTYTPANALPSENVTSLVVDHNDVLWVGTDAGVARFDGETWDVFDDNDGLVDNDVLVIGVDRNNVKWFGTSHGLVSLDERNAGVADGEPKALRLFGTFPNPFNVYTTIDFELNSFGRVGIDIYNIAGQKVRTIESVSLSAGRKQIVWNGRDDAGSPVSSGVYFYRIVKGGHSVDGKMMLIK